MRYTLLRSFHAVAMMGSFGAAARSLSLSQSTLSTQVKNLEAEYGIELLHRHARGAMLTEAGRTLFAATRRLFTSEQDTHDLLSAMAGLKLGHLKIAAVGPYQVSEILARFNARHRDLRVSVTFGNSLDVQNAVLNYMADVAVLGTVEAHPDLFEIEYSRPKIVVIANRRHRLARRASIRIADLAGERIIQREAGSETRRTFEQALRKAGVQVQVAMEMGSREGMIAAVAQGIGLGAISEEEVVPHRALRVLAVADATMSTAVHVVCLAQRKEGHLVKPFLQVVEEIIQSRNAH